jgi:GNAT superfamily N-acetyltransferase
MIQGLAAYENKSKNVHASLESLRAAIAFAPSGPSENEDFTRPAMELTSYSPPARCLLVYENDGTPAAMALYFYNYSTWTSRTGIYLEDLFVQPEAQRKGYGTLLLSALAKQAVALNAGRLEWSLLKWNQPSIEFYEAVGASAMSEWVTIRVEGDRLDDLAKRV